MSLLGSLLFNQSGLAAQHEYRISNLENAKTIYQLYEFVGQSETGTITIPAEASIYDVYQDGVLDAIVVEADQNNRPTNTNSLNESGTIVQVTSVDSNGDYILDSTPIKSSCVLYFIIINDIYKSNVPLANIVDSFSFYDLAKFLRVTSSGDDAGIISLTQFSVGLPGNGKELVAGEGDSVPPDIAFHFDYANLSGSIITGATDITAEVVSDSGSSFNLFGGIAAGKVLLVGFSYPFGGVKAKITTAGVIEPDNVIGEYLMSGTTWVYAPYMVTDADFPYDQRGNAIASIDSISEQWRFGFDPDFLPTPWSKTTLTINGTDYTYYWGLFRTISAITQDAVLEQLKVHTNRFEINADGNTEYFGRSRYPKTLIAGLDRVIANTLSNPANTSVVYQTGSVAANYQENTFANNAEDGFLLVQNIVDGLDTSIPLKVDVSWYVDGSNTGDVDVQLDVFHVADGFIYDGSATPTSYSDIKTISVDSNLVRQTTSIKFLVNTLTSKDAILLYVHRDASAGNTNDTLEANIIITNVRLTGYFWRP